jgi:hypothetical protein
MIGKRAIYDYNDTYYFSIPPSVSAIADGATTSIANAAICGAEDSEARRYAEQIGVKFSSDIVTLTAAAGAGGSLSNSGSYLLPTQLEKSYELEYIVSADIGYLIEHVRVDGEVLEDASEQQRYHFHYVLQTHHDRDINIEVSFVPDPNAPDNPDGEQTSPIATEVDPDAVPVAGASAGKYANTIGVCGGKYYATTVDGETVVYELVETYGTTDESKMFARKTDVKDYAAEQGLVYGEDYDYIHLYNYNESSGTQEHASGGYYVV